MMSSTNHIVLYRIDNIDTNIISQILLNHPDRIKCISINDLSEIYGIDYDLCLTYTKIPDLNIPIIHLNANRIRIGQLVDEIENILLQNRYEDINFGNYQLNWHSSSLNHNGHIIDLTERERYIVAEILAGGKNGKSREFLLNKVWGYRSDLETHTLETHIYRIRQKIENEPDNPKRLITIEGGYKFD